MRAPSLEILGSSAPGVQVAPTEAQHAALIAVNEALERVVGPFALRGQAQAVTFDLCHGRGVVAEVGQGHLTPELRGVARPAPTQLERIPGTVEVERGRLALERATQSSLERTRKVWLPVALCAEGERTPGILERNPSGEERFFTVVFEV